MTLPGARPENPNPIMKTENQVRSNRKSTPRHSQPQNPPAVARRSAPAARRRPFPVQYKVVALRECAPVAVGNLCDSPESCWEYWKKNVATDPSFNPEVETFVAVMLNSRRKAKGHYVISTGLVDTLLVHPRETFRAAIVGAASCIVLMHNHPSGDPTPSATDISATHDLAEAGCLVKIEVADHVIVGEGNYYSFREHEYPFAAAAPASNETAMAADAWRQSEGAISAPAPGRRPGKKSKSKTSQLWLPAALLPSLDAARKVYGESREQIIIRAIRETLPRVECAALLAADCGVLATVIKTAQAKLDSMRLAAARIGEAPGWLTVIQGALATAIEKTEIGKACRPGVA